MAEAWNFLEQGVLHVQNPPTYDDHKWLCWEFIDRQARQTAEDMLMGRSGHAAAALQVQQAPAMPATGKINPVAAGAPCPGPSSPGKDSKGKAGDSTKGKSF